jgi:hypothetical protein
LLLRETTVFTARSCVCLLVTVLTAATSCAQPDGMFGLMPDKLYQGGDPVLETTSRRYYSAFPRIMAPRREWRSWQHTDGTEDRVLIYTGLGPRPVLPTLPAEAPALLKVRAAQVREGLIFLDRITELNHIGSWMARYDRQYANMLVAVYPIGAELEDQPAKRVRWHEARVRALKALERSVLIRTVNGDDPPQRYDATQFVRYGAEADLLALLAAVKRTGAEPVPFPMPPPQPPGAVRPVGAPELPNTEPRNEWAAKITPTTTAFRDLVPGAIATRELPQKGGQVLPTFHIVSAVVPPGLPVLASDAPQLRRVRLEQVIEGLTSLRHIAALMRAGDWTSAYFDETLETTLNTYRAGGELEAHSADRVPWYEARVRVLKEFELFTEARVREGNDPPHRLNLVRFHRHGAEADLLVLLDEVKKAGPRAGAPITRAAFEFKVERPSYTAFPNLKPPIRVQRQSNDPKRRFPDLDFEVRDVVPVPPLPRLTADAEPLLRVRYQQLRAGLDHMHRIQQVIDIGNWTSQFLLDHLDLMILTFRAGAAFEREPGKQRAWYEARIARLKGLERFIETRVKDGDDPPHRLNLVRIARLQAEAELLEPRHQNVVAPAPPTCARPPRDTAPH